jgi:hypothetical protein
MNRLSILVFLAFAGCSSAGFDVADPTEATDAPAGDDRTTIVDASSTSTDAPAEHDTRKGEGADTASPPPVDAVPPADAGDSAESESAPEAEAGCVPHDHDCPIGSAPHFASCLASGVPGEAATYSAALLDEQIAHAIATLPSGTTSSARFDVPCGAETCAAVTLTDVAGTAVVTWCATGPLAGYARIGAHGAPAGCPIAGAADTWR